MNSVEPIRDINLVLDIAEYLNHRNKRDYVMFMTGIYSGLRISDILPLRVREVKDKEYIFLEETKTGKTRRFPINSELKEIINEYIDGKQGFEYLFKSRKGLNKHIRRETAYRILNEAATTFGLDSIGCHTLRKTFGYHAYMQSGKNIVAIKEILNHSSIAETLIYIGVNQDTTDKVMKSLKFRRK